KAGDEERLLASLGKISREASGIVEPDETDAGMRTARPRNDRKFQSGRQRRHIRLRFRDPLQLCTRCAECRGNFEPIDAAQKSVQLVAIEVADKPWRIEQRPWPGR